MRGPNPYDVSVPYARVMHIALGLALMPGLGIGLFMVAVFGFRLPVAVPLPQLAQVHGQLQSLGYVVLFIVAVGLQLFPRFLSTPLTDASAAVVGAVVLSGAMLIRLVVQPLEPGPVRVALLLLATLGVPAGVILAGSVFHALVRQRRQPREPWRLFIPVGGLSLGGALLLYVWGGIELASGSLVVSQGVDEALIHLELAGFAASLVLAVSSRVFGRFLLLKTRTALEPWLPRLAAGWSVGLLLVAAGWLVGAPVGAWLRLCGVLLQLLVLLTWLWLVGLYNSPSRASGTPYVTNPTRRWIRIAFVFLIVSLARAVGLFGTEALLGAPPSVSDLSAARHALAQGFLLPLMVSMAARLLPIYSADVLRRKWLLEVTVDLILIGAALRVGAEMMGGYAGPAGPLVALGGTLSVLGMTLFAVGLWSSLGRLPRPRNELIMVAARDGRG